MWKRRHLAVGAVLLIGILAGLYGYYDNFHPVIEGQVYRSAQLSGPELETVIRDRGIQSIINLRGAAEDAPWYRTEQQTASRNNVKLYSIKLSAYELPHCRHLDLLMAVLESAPRPFLIHCLSGADRSGLASALALCLLKDAPLDTIVQQVSLRYLVMPFSGSTGARLFSQYQDWLAETGASHSRDTFSSWVKNGYVDHQGNMEFWIDTAQGDIFKKRPFSDGRIAEVVLTDSPVRLTGWAVWGRSKQPVENLKLAVSETILAPVSYQIARPDVMAYLGVDPAITAQHLVGWTVQLPPHSLESGCHPLSFQTIRPSNQQPLMVKTTFSICVQL